MEDSTTTTEQRLAALEERLGRIEERLDELMRSQPVRNTKLQPFKDKAYAIGGRLLACMSQKEFLIVRQEYLDLLNEAKAILTPKEYEAFKNTQNATMRGIYDKKRKEWPVDNSGIVAARQVPIHLADCRYDNYFQNADDAVDYIAQNAKSEEHVMLCVPPFCKSFGGLNASIYAEIIIERWRECHTGTGDQ